MKDDVSVRYSGVMHSEQMSKYKYNILLHNILYFQHYDKIFNPPPLLFLCVFASENTIII